MAISSAGLNVMATAIAGAVTHVGLVDETGTELTGGGYARQAATMTATGAEARLTADETFDVPAGETVAGWRAFSASTAGTNYGGGDLTPETYTGAGQHVLEADTGFDVSASA